ncbi:hypothetical protein [Streptomyces marincola]|uniref:HTH cro/C1-type domain-containing protein n=1 Tax=Streptomyces marincola TaxID=2878388 RepID=A0A1W7CWT8_9ACTN|nr:hypothetical protein [Streptomyces marincola]ARQ69167.1 hypothetical protein CAG99_10100 [Streptomyces marincola]
MPITDEGASASRRTLAEKLKRLRDMKAPHGEPPPSYEVTARQITEATGISISGPYFWELATGRTTNPKLRHLQALARFYRVPVSYLADDEPDHEQLESELELLHRLKQGSTSERPQVGAPDADFVAVESLLTRLHALDGFGDTETREAALQLNSLQAAERTELLPALENEQVRALARAAGRLATDLLTTAVVTLGEPDLLGALTEEDAREAAVRIARLSPASRQAVLTLMDHLRRVENPSDD